MNEIMNSKGIESFNALLRASFFSTDVKLHLVIVQHQKVSMPYFGLLSFLLNETDEDEENDICFNALLRASFFST